MSDLDEDDYMLTCMRCGLPTVVQIGKDRLCLDCCQLEDRENGDRDAGLSVQH